MLADERGLSLWAEQEKMEKTWQKALQNKVSDRQTTRGFELRIQYRVARKKISEAVLELHNRAQRPETLPSPPRVSPTLERNSASVLFLVFSEQISKSLVDPLHRLALGYFSAGSFVASVASISPRHKYWNSTPLVGLINSHMRSVF